MHIFAKTENKKSSLGMYLLIYYLIIGSDCIVFCYNQNEALPRYSQYFMVAMSVCFLFISIYKNKYMLNKKDIFLFFTIIFLIISAIVHSEFSGGYISLIALFVLGNCFFNVIDPNEFKKIFLNIMMVICIVSLLTFVFSGLFLKLPFFPSVYNNIGREYRFFFFSNISLIDTGRNYGLFTEPSRFQAYINLALLFLLFDNEKKVDVKKAVLFIITLITTFSTTGFIAFSFIISAFILSGKTKISSFYKISFVAFFCIIAIFLFLTNEDFYNSIIKLSSGQNSISFSTRINSFFANLKIISENLFFGAGISNADAAFSEALRSLGGASATTNTITFLIYFSKFGIITGLYYAYNMVNAVRNIGNKNNTIFLIIGFIAATGGISFINSILFSIIVFYPKTETVKVLENEETSYAYIGN